MNKFGAKMQTNIAKGELIWVISLMHSELGLEQP